MNNNNNSIYKSEFKYYNTFNEHNNDNIKNNDNYKRKLFENSKDNNKQSKLNSKNFKKIYKNKHKVLNYGYCTLVGHKKGNGIS